MQHTIQQGDTVLAIAKKYGVSEQELLSVNSQIADSNTIYAGEQLTIPTSTNLTDPATLSAQRKSKSSISNPVESCPYREQWWTIKPQRYVTVEKGSAVIPSKNLNIQAGLPELKHNEYAVRELAEHCVYLYHPLEDYLLEVTYKQGAAVGHRCVFGDPVSEVSKALPLLKQRKNAKFIMWLTHEPLTPKKISVLRKNPNKEIIGQKIDLAKAAIDAQEDACPLFNIKQISAELITTDEASLLHSSVPLCSVEHEQDLTDEHDIKNSFSVCLSDPISIVTDLCREFSIEYHKVMTSISVAEHPLNIANLTEAVIAQEMKSRVKSIKKNVEATKAIVDSPRSHYTGMEVVVPKYSDSVYKKMIEDKTKKAHDQLKECVYLDEMKEYQQTYKEVMPEIKKELENLSEDWLLWLEHKQLDWALALLDDTDPAQIDVKEAILMAMTNNLEATDKGIEIADKWSEKLLALLESKKITIDGAGAHVLIGLGFFEKLILTASKALKELHGTADSSQRLAEIAANRENLLKTSQMPSTVALDYLVYSVAPSLVRTIGHIENHWERVYGILGYRYGFRFPMQQANMGDLARDIHASQAVSIFVATDHMPNIVSYKPDKTTVGLYSVSHSVAPDDTKPLPQVEKHARFWIKQINGENLLKEKGAFMTAYNASSELFTPKGVQNTTVGFFFLVQCYNLYKVTNTMRKDTVKYTIELTNAFTGLVTSSFAVLDTLMGERFGKVDGKQAFSKYLQSEWADKVGSGASKRVTGVLSELKIDSTYNLARVEKLGKAVTSTIRGTFRWLPVVGAATAVLLTGYQLVGDIGNNQNVHAMVVSGLSLLVDGAAAYFAWVALVPAAAPVVAVMAVVLGISAILLQVYRSSIMNTPIELMLKGSFWGRGRYYNHASGMNSLEKRRELFTANNVKSKRVIKAVQKELTVFTDFLFKPVPRVIEKPSPSNLSVFTLAISLPGYVPLQSNVSVSVYAYGQKEKVLLSRRSDKSGWGPNHINGTLYITKDKVTQLVFEIDERELKRNYRNYELALEYHNPGGYPVTLRYDKIGIDDDKSWFEFWRNKTELENFKVNDLKEEMSMTDYWEEHLYDLTQ